jgi:hypothetical protein
MGYTPSQEQLPVLCKACGGATTPRDDLSLECPYCGAKDKLPDNELDRALELKRRVGSRAASVAQLEGLSAALASIFEDRGAFLRVTSPWLVVAVLVTVWQLLGSWSAIDKAPSNLKLPLMLYAAMGTLWISGICLAFVVALAVGRSRYRRAVRPLLMARPPRRPGAPSRCRACGGDLPDDRGPLIRCRFCRTHSLVTPELQSNREQLLRDEEAAYRSQAAKVSSTTARSSVNMSRILVIAVVITYLAVIGLAKVASALIPH